MMAPDTVAQLAIAVPLAGAVLIWMSRRNPNLREAVTLVTAGTLFVLVASCLLYTSDAADE